MNHAQLGLIVLDDLAFYLTVYFSLVALYFVLYRKVIWFLLDPMIWTVISMAGGAFCVLFLYLQGQLDPVYQWSFITTEIAIITGFAVSAYVPRMQYNLFRRTDGDEERVLGISEFDVFTWFVGVAYILCEMVSIATVGIVILDTDNTHNSAFNDHGILMAFVTSYRLLCPLVLFYKSFVLNRKLNAFDVVCWTIAAFGLLTTGAKGAILVLVFIYFMTKYPLIYQRKVKPIKISIPLIIILAAFPITVISLRTGADSSVALRALFIRFLSSGDVFLLGYNDRAMSAITETSFLKYAFYPGWGTVLKNLGFPLTPPKAIGLDLVELHYSSTTGGPNGRHNYIAYYFIGFWWAIVYSFGIGVFIGWARNSYRNINLKNLSYYGYLFALILAYISGMLVDDINIFANYVFWRIAFLTLSFVAAKCIFILLKYRVNRNTLSTEPNKISYSKL